MLIERMRKRLAAERASFMEPCLPSPADKPPSGSSWISVKHDGFRLMARRHPVAATSGAGHLPVSPFAHASHPVRKAPKSDNKWVLGV
jgi:hypothetical protein